MLQKTKLTLLRVFAVVAFVVLFAFASIGLASCSSDSYSIQSMIIDPNTGELVVTYTNGDEVNLGKIVGEDGTPGTNGTDGKDGVDGADGADGKDGVDGADGADGKDGVDGTDGKDGADGVDGADGADGKDGADGVGISSIVLDGESLVITYTDNNVTTIDISGILSGGCECDPTCSHVDEEGESTYVDAWIIKEVTCGEDGLVLQYCTICSNAIVKVVPATHLHTYDYSDIAWKWAEDYSSATATVTCTECGNKLTTDAVVTSETTVEETCVDKGEIVYTATITVDGKDYTDSQTVEVAATGAHTYNGHTIVLAQVTSEERHVVYIDGRETPASYEDLVAVFGEENVKIEHCDAGAYIVSENVQCEVCQNFLYGVSAEVFLHIEGTAVVENEVPAECETEGSYDSVIYCERCGDEVSRDTITVPATGHTYTAPDGTVYTIYVIPDADGTRYLYINDSTDPATKADLEAIGITVGTLTDCELGYPVTCLCDDCGEFEGYTAGFDHTAAEAVIENMTNVEEVNGEIVATDCDESLTYSYDSVVYCSVCGKVLSTTTVEVDPLAHSYEAVVTAPTCTEAGYTTYTCTVCNDTYVADEVAALGHSYEATKFDWTSVEMTDELGNTVYDADGNVAYEYTAAVLTLTCSVCGDVVGDLECTVTATYIAKTCMLDEAWVYTASYTYEDIEYTDEITVTLDYAYGYHQSSTGYKFTLELIESGRDYEYYIYLYGGTEKLTQAEFAAIGGIVTTNDCTIIGYGSIYCELCNTMYTVVLLPNGETHTIGNPEWTWSTDYSEATVSGVCTDESCDQFVTETAVITSETDETAGTITYTAIVTLGENIYTDVKVVTIVKAETATTVTLDSENYVAEGVITVETTGYYAVDFSSEDAYIVITSEDGAYSYTSESGAKLLKSAKAADVETLLNYICGAKGNPVEIPAGTVLYIKVVLNDREIEASVDVSFTIAIDETYVPEEPVYDYTLTSEGLEATLEGGTSAWVPAVYEVYVSEAGTYVVTVDAAGDITVEINGNESTSVYEGGSESFELAVGDVVTISAYATSTVSITVEEADAYALVVGNNELLPEVEYTFTAPADGTYTITLTAGDIYYANVWAGEEDYNNNWTPAYLDVQGDGSYSFNVTMDADGVIAIYISGSNGLTLTIALAEEGGDDEPAVETVVPTLVVGDNAIVLSDDDGSDGYTTTFTATATGSYTFSAVDDNAYVEVDEHRVYGEAVTYTVNLVAGASVTVVLYSYDYHTASYTLTISYEAPAVMVAGTDYVVTLDGDYNMISTTVTITEAGYYTVSVTEGAVISIQDEDGLYYYNSNNMAGSFIVDNTNLDGDVAVLIPANTVLNVNIYLTGSDELEVTALVALADTITAGEDYTVSLNGDDYYVSTIIVIETAGYYTVSVSSNGIVSISDVNGLYYYNSNRVTDTTYIVDNTLDENVPVYLPAGTVLDVYINIADTSVEEYEDVIVNIANDPDYVPESGETTYNYTINETGLECELLSDGTYIGASYTIYVEVAGTYTFTVDADGGITIEDDNGSEDLSSGASKNFTFEAGAVITVYAYDDTTLTVTVYEEPEEATFSGTIYNISDYTGSAVTAGTVLIENVLSISSDSGSLRLNTGCTENSNYSVDSKATIYEGVDLDTSIWINPIMSGTGSLTFVLSSDANVTFYYGLGNSSAVFVVTDGTINYVEVSDSAATTAYKVRSVTVSLEAGTYIIKTQVRATAFLYSIAVEPTTAGGDEEATVYTATAGKIYNGNYVEFEITGVPSDLDLTTDSNLYTVYYNGEVASWSNVFWYGDSSLGIYHAQIQLPEENPTTVPASTIQWIDDDGNVVATAYVSTVTDYYTFSMTELAATIATRTEVESVTEDTALVASDFETKSNSFLTLLNEQSSNRYRPTTGGTCIEVKGESFEVTFSGTGTITITFASTGGSNTSSLGLYYVDEEGNTVYVAATSTTATEATTEDDAIYYTVEGTTYVSITFTVEEAGTYTIATNIGGEGRAARIQTIEMVDTYEAE